MNKVLIVSNVLFLLIIAYLLTQDLKEPVPVVLPVENPICKDYSQEPFNGISFESAKSLFQNYEYQYKRIDNLPDGSGMDAQSVWFDLETLKKFFFKIEDTLNKQKVNLDKLKLGIRIYYGSYPAKEDLLKEGNGFYGLPEEYAKHHTVFMVPTFNDPKDDKTHNDFNPWYPELDANNTPTSTARLLEMQNDSIFTNVQKTPGILSVDGKVFLQNHGQVDPPPQSNIPGVSLFRTLAP